MLPERLKVCFADSEEEGVRIAHERWANEGLPGELAQVLPSPNYEAITGTKMRFL